MGARLRRKQALIAWGFCLPFVLVFGVFMLVPLLGSFGMSFTDFTARDIRSPFSVNFIGLQQYTDLFADARFRQSLLVTGLFVVIGIPLTMVVALALALALNSGSGRIVSLFRVGFYARWSPASSRCRWSGGTSCSRKAWPTRHSR